MSFITFVLKICKKKLLLKTTLFDILMGKLAVLLTRSLAMVFQCEYRAQKRTIAISIRQRGRWRKILSRFSSEWGRVRAKKGMKKCLEICALICLCVDVYVYVCPCTFVYVCPNLCVRAMYMYLTEGARGIYKVDINEWGKEPNRFNR